MSPLDVAQKSKISQPETEMVTWLFQIRPQLYVFLKSMVSVTTCEPIGQAKCSMNIKTEVFPFYSGVKWQNYCWSKLETEGS